MGCAGLDGCRERHTFYASITFSQQLVGALFDPLRYVSVGRATVGRIVLEAAVLRRVMRGRNNDAVGKVILAITVVREDRSRDDGRRRDAVVALDDRLHVVGRQHFERCALRRSGYRVRVLTHIERAIRTLTTPVLTDRLCDSDNMSFGERAF